MNATQADKNVHAPQPHDFYIANLFGSLHLIAGIRMRSLPLVTRWLSNILLFVCPLLLMGCATMSGRDPLQVTVAGIEPLEGQGLELRLNVKLRVQNPNDAPVQYNGVTVNMDVRQRPFASGVTDASGAVPRFGETVIDVPVTVSSGRIIQQAVEMMMGGSRGKIEYEMKGKLANGTFNTTRFSAKGSFDMPVAKDDF